jgi:hypothetical protein
VFGQRRMKSWLHLTRTTCWLLYRTQVIKDASALWVLFRWRQHHLPDYSQDWLFCAKFSHMFIYCELRRTYCVGKWCPVLFLLLFTCCIRLVALNHCFDQMSFLIEYCLCLNKMISSSFLYLLLGTAVSYSVGFMLTGCRQHTFTHCIALGILFVYWPLISIMNSVCWCWIF